MLAHPGSLSGLSHLLQQCQQQQGCTGLATEAAWLLAHVLTSGEAANKAVAAGVLPPMHSLLQAAAQGVIPCCTLSAVVTWQCISPFSCTG